MPETAPPPPVPPEFAELGRFVCGVKHPQEPFCGTFILETPTGYLWHVREGHGWTFLRINAQRAIEAAASMRSLSPAWFVVGSRTPSLKRAG